MADEKSKLRTDAGSVADWVDAYWGDNNEGLNSRGDDLAKKPEKFKHLQHLATFSTFCFYVNNNSPKAHIDFFGTNYTHMTTAVEKSAKLIMLLLQKKFENSDPESGTYYTLTEADFVEANSQVGLFSPNQMDSKLISDYIDNESGLVSGCSHFMPVFKDNNKTVKNLQEMNNDETILQHHSELVGKYGEEGGCALKLKDIRTISRRTVEVASKTWEDVEARKSSNLAALSKHAEESFMLNRDLAIKTGKVAALGAGAAYCVGSVIGGMFFPAFGLIPIYVMAKRWLPDFFKSLGARYQNHIEKRKDRRNQKIALAEEYYLTHDGKIRFRDRIAGRMPGPVKELMSKQLKTMNLLYGKDNLAEATGNLNNAGSLSSPKDKDNQVPADILGRWEGYVSNIENMVEGFKNNEKDSDDKPKFSRQEIFDKIKTLAEDIKNFDSQVPEDSQKRQIYKKFYDQTFKFFDSMLFENEFSGDVEKAFGDYSSDKTIVELIEKDKFGENLAIRLKNMRAYISEEKKPIYVEGKTSTFNMIGGGMGVGLLGLTANNATTAKTEYLKIESQDATIDALIDEIYSSNCNEKDSAGNRGGDILARINALANDKTKKYLTHLLECRRAATLFNENQLVTEFSSLIGGAPSTDASEVIREISQIEMRMPTGEKDKNCFGQIFSKYDSTSLQQIKDRIAGLQDVNEKTKLTGLLDEQLRKLNTKIQLDAKASATKSIRGELDQGTWKFFGGNFKNEEGKTGPVIDDATLTYSEEGFKNADKIFNNISSIIPGVGKLDYLYFKLSDFMYTKVFQPKIQEFKSISPKMEDLVDFFKRVKTARYLNDAQKSDLTAQASSLIYRVFNSEYNIMREDYVNKFNADKFNNLTLDLESGGFAEVFKQNTTMKELVDAIQDVKDSKRILSVLNFESIKANPEELKYISQVYFYENADKNSAPTIRANNDNLKIFMTRINNLNATYGNCNYNNTADFENDSVVISLKDIMNDLNNWVATDPKDLHDKYAACLVLKNKAIAMFRAYVQGYLSKISSGHSSAVDALRQQGQMNDFTEHVIKIWKEAVGNDIESLMSGCVGGLGFNGMFKSFNAELSKYTSEQNVVTAANSKEMGE